MYEIELGSFKAKIYASVLEDSALQQIYKLYDHPALAGGQVAIMSDAHAGCGCVIGFTGKFTGGIIPSFVGMDGSCGVYSYKIPKIPKFDFADFDRYVRENIPMGFSSRSEQQILDLEKIFTLAERQKINNLCYCFEQFLSNNFEKYTNPKSQLGTMGSGNHFIEIEDAGDFWIITVHSGSRNLGQKYCTHFQDLADWYNQTYRHGLSKDTAYLSFKESVDAERYLMMASDIAEYADFNRQAMIRIILKYMGVTYDPTQMIKSVHNYVSRENGEWVVRKGAISAKLGEKVVIPLSMKRGIILGTGLGNPDFNYSAPHGAGRKHSRGEMKRLLESGNITMESFADSMNGIWTSSVDPSTIDESDFAYKDDKDVFNELSNTVEIECVAKPIYVVKASTPTKRCKEND